MIQKSLKLISLVICFSLLSCKLFYKDSSYKYFNKAYKLYESGRYDRALKLLDLEQKNGLWTCGIGAIESNNSQNILRAKIWLGRENFDMCHKYLDSISYNGNRFEVGDSMRVHAYQSQFGKKTLSELIDTSLYFTVIDQFNYDNLIAFAKIPLHGSPDSLRFNLNMGYSLRTGQLQDSLRTSHWVKKFKESKTYEFIRYPENFIQ